jgi:hypothetical protein
MVHCKERRHSRTEVIAARTIAGIPKFGHEPMPALRNVSVVDADLGWARRESIPWQGGHDHVEVLEHRQNVQVVEETAGPAVREDEWHTTTGCGAGAVSCRPKWVVDAWLALPGTPLELIGPVGHEVPQPVQLSACPQPLPVPGRAILYGAMPNRQHLVTNMNRNGSTTTTPPGVAANARACDQVTTHIKTCA